MLRPAGPSFPSTHEQGRAEKPCYTKSKRAEINSKCQLGQLKRWCPSLPYCGTDGRERTSLGTVVPAKPTETHMRVHGSSCLPATVSVFQDRERDWNQRPRALGDTVCRGAASSWRHSTEAEWPAGR